MKTITYIIREIVYDNGRQEILCMNNTEYAGFLKRKYRISTGAGRSIKTISIKKKILSNKKLFSFSIQLKNHLK